MQYQAIDNSVVLSTTNKNNLSNNGQNEIDWDFVSKVVQCSSIKKKSSCLQHERFIILLKQMY